MEPRRVLRSVRVLAAVLAVASVSSPAGAADKCRGGASAVQDARSIASLRVVIDDACPCASFDGTSTTTNRART